jgi:TFIIF-interacting CTD phosphatase-like protein
MSSFHIVLDLDETLIHARDKPIAGRPVDFAFKIGGVAYYGHKRPGLAQFLQFIFRKFKSVSIWTAASRSYAVNVLRNILTAEQQSRVLFFKSRQDLATRQDGNYYKPLVKMMNDPMGRRVGMTSENTIMIDDRNDVLQANPGNGIQIPAWRGDDNDDYLLKLIIILEGIHHHQISFRNFDKVIDLRELVD